MYDMFQNRGKTGGDHTAKVQNCSRCGIAMFQLTSEGEWELTGFIVLLAEEIVADRLAVCIGIKMHKTFPWNWQSLHRDSSDSLASLCSL